MDKKEKIEKVESEVEFLYAIIQSISDAISVVDEMGRFKIINKAYVNNIGARREELIEKPLEVSLPNGEESIHKKVLKSQKAVRGIRKRIGKNNKFVSVDASPIFVNDIFKGSVAIIHDFISIKAIAEELDREKNNILSNQINKAKYSFENILGRTDEINAAIESAKLVANTSLTVLIQGESGTGKELFAQAIHNSSNRANHKFIGVNCTTLTESLLDSLLFGYVSGAYTGAKRNGQKGIFEEANKGTIFLDEIGKMSLSLQAKLLRVIQERTITRVGDTSEIPVDVRIIAATNMNLYRQMENKLFREDLFYRLNVYPIRIPSLRERKEDIDIISMHILKKFCEENGRSEINITEGSIEALKGHDWPGNIRELENVLYRSAVNIGSQTKLLRQHIRFLKKSSASFSNTSCDTTINKDSYLEAFECWEKAFILKNYKEMNYVKTKTASKLGICVRTLYDKLKKYDIE